MPDFSEPTSHTFQLNNRLHKHPRGCASSGGSSLNLLGDYALGQLCAAENPCGFRVKNAIVISTLLFCNVMIMILPRVKTRD